jgi:hypothetical protein
MPRRGEKFTFFIRKLGSEENTTMTSSGHYFMK